MEPQPGVAYPLVLGGTLLGKRKAGEEYCSLRYDFLPASAARAGQGHLEVHADSHVRQGGVGGRGLLPGGASGQARVVCWGRSLAARLRQRAWTGRVLCRASLGFAPHTRAPTDCAVSGPSFHSSPTHSLTRRLPTGPPWHLSLLLTRIHIP